MQIHLTGRNIDLTPALKTFATEKLQKLDQRGDGIAHVYVTFHIENITHTAEATLRVHGVDLHAEGKAEDMYSAIDRLTDRMIQQITRLKERTEGGRSHE